LPKIHFSVSIPTRGTFALPKNIVRMTKHAESLGWDSVATGDHIYLSPEKHKFYSHGMVKGPDTTDDPNIFETVSTLSYLAGTCPEIEFHTTVLFLPGRNPVVLAKELATMDVLTGGRLVLGVGVGNATDQEEYDALGLPLKERWHIGEEYVSAMKEIWTTHKSSYHGKFVNFQDLYVYPKPVTKPHIPIWFGGKSPMAQRMAARYATGWVPQFMTPEMHGEGLANIKRLAREYGRGDVKFTVGAQANVSLASSHAKAEERWRIRLADTKTLLAHTGFMREIGGTVREELTKRAIIGTPSQVIERLDPYVKNGVNLFEVHFTYTTMNELAAEMSTLAKEVMPSFK
jgi:probable F420-dependent oxidoreductase